MRADFVIVGGGVYGLATAWTLATRGASVLVLEAGEVAAGASGGLGKRGVRANGRDIRELPLMREAYDLWPRLHETLGAPTGYERVGHLQLYERYHDIGQADVRARVQQALGIPTTHLDSLDRVRGVEPGVAGRVLGALHAPLDGVADHVATTRAYGAAAARAGATIRTGAQVTDIVRDSTRATAVVLASGERVEVGRELILLANGGTADLVARLSSTRLPIWTIYPQVVVSTSAASAPFTSYVGHAHRPVALKMVPGNVVMLSGGWRGRWNPDTRRGETTQASVTANWGEAIALFPAIEQLSIAEGTADRAETNALDQIPVIDRVPGTSNVLVGCGWTGHGWAIAPAAAPYVAEWALSGVAPDALKPFTLARFPQTPA